LTLAGLRLLKGYGCNYAITLIEHGNKSFKRYVKRRLGAQVGTSGSMFTLEL